MARGGAARIGRYGMTWAFGELAPFDTESTAANPEEARLVSATVAHIAPGVETQVSSHLVAVEEDIPAEATAIHGITTEHARENGKPAAEVLEAIAAHLTELMANGIAVVGMNLSYDMTLLDRELRRHNRRTLDDRLGREPGPLIDVFVIDKTVDRYRKGGRKLTDLCATYGVRIDGAHDATFDALAAARVAYRMCQRAQMDRDKLVELYADRPRQAPHIAAAFQALGGMSLADLHQAQKGWYAAQAGSFAQYLRKEANEAEHRAEVATDDAERATALEDMAELRRRADGVSSDWPVRPLGGAA